MKSYRDSYGCYPEVLVADCLQFWKANFPYKGKLAGTTTILGGKGGGDCGGIFEVGKEYLIVVFKCDKGYYTYLCSDNALKSNASTQNHFSE